MVKQVKKTAKKTVSKKHMIAQYEPEPSSLLPVDVNMNEPKKMRWSMLVVGLIFVVLVFAASRGYIVAALVNGSPIFRWDIEKMLVSRYGQQTLESMVSEKLIADAARKQGVVISKSDIDKKTDEVVKSLGPNVKLEDLLKYQGMTQPDFEHQISLQLTVEKILGKDVSVTDIEVDEFVSKNKETMVATDAAAMRGEARSAILSQKINEKIQPWFAKLKESAKVVRLMK